ncbi:MAG: hypothetical protein ACK4R3_04085 [Aliihoeflea sp.]|uniref:hypothetical protein n=1 Tax=Aliihoeflea sp. 40Bstr573 TaxID=2696467 RepID=UPI0020945CE4|nr:hypothetical protein [Aliihoeflea sp. 40Bstr573]MCO6389061.1 hypothetical protein [Aliihoeflea sp. 40Bstr573]
MPALSAGHEEEIAEAVCEIAVLLAQAIHQIDPDAAQRMNFAAGKAFNRHLGQDQKLAADLMYRFGRALVDRSLFPVGEGGDEQLN